MTEEEKAAADAAKDEALKKANEQIENLNKGIAAIRDDAKASKEAAAEATKAATLATEKLAEFEKLNDKKDDGVVLTLEEEKKLEAYAKKHGLVGKADLDAERARVQGEAIKAHENQAVEEFLAKHPEYDADEKWKAVMTEFALYRQPTTKAAYSALLERIHKDLSGDTTKDAQAKARAEIINRNKLGLGGKSQGGTEDEAEAELDRLAKRYPNLTRDQILERLVEIKKLQTKK